MLTEVLSCFLTYPPVQWNISTTRRIGTQCGPDIQRSQEVYHIKTCHFLHITLWPKYGLEISQFLACFQHVFALLTHINRRPLLWDTHRCIFLISCMYLVFGCKPSSCWIIIKLEFKHRHLCVSNLSHWISSTVSPNQNIVRSLVFLWGHIERRIYRHIDYSTRYTASYRTYWHFADVREKRLVSQRSLKLADSQESLPAVVL